MRFFTPLGLLALLAVPLVILMYLLKQKYKEKEISSLYLWKKALQESRSQEPWQRLRKNILMFMQIVAVLLLALALGGPYYMGKTQVTDYVLALDVSMSMQAADMDGSSRFEEAKKDMIKLVEEAPPETSFSLVVLSGNPTVLFHATSQKQTIIQGIRNIEVTYATVDWNGAKVLLESEKNALGGEIILYSDAYGKLGALSVLEQVYHKSSENVGITLFSYVEQEAQVNALVKIQNFGELEQERQVTLFADGVVVDTRSVVLSAGQSTDITFQEINRETKEMMVRLFPDDLLPADDIMYEVLQESEQKRTLLVTERNLFLEKAFSLMDKIELYKTTPSNMVSSQLSGYQLYIFDGYVPEELPTDGHIFLIQPHADNGIVTVGAEVMIAETVRAASNTGFADIERMYFELAKGSAISASWGKPLLRSGNTTMAVFGTDGEQKIVVFGFDIHDSDLPLTMNFPVLLYRLMEWYFPERVSGVDSVYAEDSIDFSLQAQSRRAWVETPGGGVVDIAPPFPARTFTQTRQVGIYRLVEEDAEGEKTETRFVVHPKSLVESDLSLQGEEGNYMEGGSKTVTMGKSLVSIVILLLLLLLLAEWRVNCREH